MFAVVASLLFWHFLFALCCAFWFFAIFTYAFVCIVQVVVYCELLWTLLGVKLWCRSGLLFPFDKHYLRPKFKGCCLFLCSILFTHIVQSARLEARCGSTVPSNVSYFPTGTDSGICLTVWSLCYVVYTCVNMWLSVCVCAVFSVSSTTDCKTLNTGTIWPMSC